MPSITARPQPMLIARNDPFAPLLSTVWATTPTPNAMRMNVPKNSAAASRAVPLSMRGILLHAEHDDVLPGEHVDHPLEGEAFGLELRLDLGHAHLVDLEN